jgi:hypothetical protein
MQAGSAWKFLPPAGFFILSFHPVISGSVAMDPINPMIRGIPIPGSINRLNGWRVRVRVSAKKNRLNILESLDVNYV